MAKIFSRPGPHDVLVEHPEFIANENLTAYKKSYSAQHGAASLAADALPPGRLQDDAVARIAQRWSQRQPEIAAAWVEQFPRGELKRAAVESVSAQWLLRDPAKASQWRNRMAADDLEQD
jgi:hypothetical protein